MAQFYPGGKKIFPQSIRDSFKYEVAEELGLTTMIKDDYWGALTSKDCGRVGGRIGGSMVKAMVRRAEEMLVEQEKGNNS
ncbi:alpha/beta-type small acid-soluble spore protein [Heliorestis acidaminivorans]|uniref:Alpha/beta-type small acid-soluble spore protein n=1 Tax=Heliorestis acidaminivorans TaxID=553427 RepID=A0A6I0F5R4_9FIRM|nr:alpha/beta-type small acid-soluble spore protein [Heliorestis acidaminivorans]KAB2954312.1 alpha/beta-type small acid-soluble spore protein [Heliorestis acidaminivorans]